MKLWNQLEYAHLPYPTDVDNPLDVLAHAGTVETSGCGLCAACMAVERLSLESFTVEDCLALAHACGADHEPGTDMKRLAPAVAEKFSLDLHMTDDVQQLAACLRQGGAAVINVGGNRRGHKGVFSTGGHYITAISVRGDTFCLLDPEWEPEKYAKPPRSRVVRQSGAWLYARAEALEADTANRSPAYYLFWRKGEQEE